MSRTAQANVPHLMALVGAAQMVQAISVAAELRIPDLLAAGPKTSDQIAEATDCHAPSVQRLLRATVSLGLCMEQDDGRFALAEIGGLLRSDAPRSLRAWTIWCGRHMWSVWGGLRESVKTGKSAQQRADGDDAFGQFDRDPATAAAFNGAMLEITRLITEAVVRNYDFSGIHRIADVGGGHGALIAAVLKAHLEMQGVIFDLPHAMAGARAYLTHEGVADRCDVLAGDFFHAIPGGAGVYLLKNIIHDWDDERSVAILRNCRKAMPQDGRLVLIEQIAPGRLEESPSHRAIASIDLAMLVGPGGRQRTQAEFCALFASSGLALARTIETALGYSIIECVAA